MRVFVHVFLDEFTGGIKFRDPLLSLVVEKHLLLFSSLSLGGLESVAMNHRYDCSCSAMFSVVLVAEDVWAV